jgi:hypothetical protein
MAAKTATGSVVVGDDDALGPDAGTDAPDVAERAIGAPRGLGACIGAGRMAAKTATNRAVAATTIL